MVNSSYSIVNIINEHKQVTVLKPCTLSHVIIEIVHVFGKILIEHTPTVKTTGVAFYNSLVVICNEYWSTSKYQVKINQ